MTPMSEGTLLWQRRKYALAGLVLVAVLIAVRVGTGTLAPLPWEGLRDAVSLSTAILIESFPFIMLGILLSIVVRVWVSSAFFARVIPTHPVARRIVMSFVGVLLPVCECGNVPLARGLLRQGLSHGDVMAFTLSAPLLNPVTIVTTYQAFGSENGILWGRVLGGFLIAQAVAFLATYRRAAATLSTDVEVDESGEACAVPHHDHSRVGESMRIFRDETRILMPPLIFGALVAGIIQVGISRSVLLAVGQDPYLSVLAMMALAFIISICSSVDAFFALSLAALFPPGALIAFLIFGAMVDIKMLMLLRTTFTTSVLIRMVASITVLCALVGMGVNLLGIGA